MVASKLDQVYDKSEKSNLNFSFNKCSNIMEVKNVRNLFSHVPYHKGKRLLFGNTSDPDPVA